MKEEILHLSYLLLRVEREENRQMSGEQDIKDRIYLLHLEGNIDLNQSADSNKDESNAQNPNKSADSLNESESEEEKIEDIKEIPAWVKKLEREIIKKTHPDKLLDNDVLKEDKKNYFLKTKEIIKSEEFIDLLPIALNLGISIEDNSEELVKDVKKRIKLIIEKISEIEKTTSWQWEDYTEDQKTKVIDIILKKSGIKRTEKEIKDILRKVIKRKTGTRPVSLREMRNLK